MYTTYRSTQPVTEMSTRGISWGVKSSPPYIHDCSATPSLICTLITCWSISFSFTLTVICPLALPLTQSLIPLFIIYTFKHSLNFFTSSLHVLLYVISSLFPATSNSLALSNCSSFSALSPIHFFIHSFILTEQKYVAYNERLHFSQLPATLQCGHNIHTLLLTLSGMQTKLPVLDMLLKLSAVQTKFPVSLQCLHNHAHLHFNQLTEVCIIYHNSCVSLFSL